MKGGEGRAAGRSSEPQVTCMLPRCFSPSQAPLSLSPLSLPPSLPTCALSPFHTQSLPSPSPSSRRPSRATSATLPEHCGRSPTEPAHGRNRERAGERRARGGRERETERGRVRGRRARPPTSCRRRHTLPSLPLFFPPSLPRSAPGPCPPALLPLSASLPLPLRLRCSSELCTVLELYFAVWS